jgi:pyruvate/2-oxoglutarate/acetoin dehydrogenase E1 component
MDAIVNHIDKIERISHGEFKVPIIIRAVAADAGPFYSGITHSQDFTSLLKTAVSFPVSDPKNGKEILRAFRDAVATTASKRWTPLVIWPLAACFCSALNQRFKVLI